MTSSLTPQTIKAWQKLQALSCQHANEIGPRYIKTWPKAQISVPGVIEENCTILGRGDEEEIKHRIHWYITFYPGVFDRAARS